MYKYVVEVVAISVNIIEPDESPKSNFYYKVDHLEPNRETYLMPFDGCKHEDIEIVQGWYGNQSYEDRDQITGNDTPPYCRVS